MRILAIDYGLRKIGLAYSEGYLSEPLKVIDHKNWELEIKKICREKAVEKIIVGITEGTLAREQKDFAQRLEDLTQLPVEFQDETLTTQDALAKMRQIGKRVKEEDAIAAALILDAYLERQGNV
ncbi:MAG: Holliday junction resolvase RuvX [bacterium]|nr:Holliday junction resolvase RuvX [bacterium]